MAITERISNQIEDAKDKRKRELQRVSDQKVKRVDDQKSKVSENA